MGKKKIIAFNLLLLFGGLGLLQTSLMVVLYLKGGSKLYEAALNKFSTVMRISKNKNFKNSERKFDKILQLRNIGKEAFPSYHWNPKFHSVKDTFWISRPSNSIVVRKDEGSGIIPYPTNALGHRKTSGEDLNGEINFILIGDSFAEGCCVASGSTVADWLNKKSGKNVINLGMSGTGPIRQLATLREIFEYQNQNKIYLSKNTKIIWLIFSSNDLHDLRQERILPVSEYVRNSNYSNNYYTNIEKISLKQREFLNKIITDSNFFNKVQKYDKQSLEMSELENDFNDYKVVFKVLKDEVEKRGIELIPVLLYDYPDTPRQSNVGIINERFKNFFKNEVDIKNIIMISFNDIKPRLINNHEAGQRYGHFDEKGYENIAKEIILKINN